MEGVEGVIKDKYKVKGELRTAEESHWHFDGGSQNFLHIILLLQIKFIVIKYIANYILY